MKIAPATDNHLNDIRNIHLNAFPGAEEADLVDQLHNSGDAEISLIALDADQLIGHVMFSKLAAPFKALALAPVAVDQNYRRQGIARKLIDEGLNLARKDGWDCVVVLGNPDYYQRFGFSLELGKNIDCPYSGPHLMAMSLGGFNLPAPTKVIYAKAFDGL